MLAEAIKGFSRIRGEAVFDLEQARRPGGQIGAWQVRPFVEQQLAVGGLEA
jgi:hypothetical protein